MSALSAKRSAVLEIVAEGKVFFWRSGKTINYESVGRHNSLHVGTMRWLHDSGYIATEGDSGKVYVTSKGADALSKLSVAV